MAFIAEEVDNTAVVPGDAHAAFTEIEGEGDQLRSGRQLDASDRAAQPRRHWYSGVKSFLFECGEIESDAPGRPQFLVRVS